MPGCLYKVITDAQDEWEAMAISQTSHNLLQLKDNHLHLPAEALGRDEAAGIVPWASQQ
jgi:hypothetical protein